MTTPTTWYEASLVYLRALDIPLDVNPVEVAGFRYPFSATTREAFDEWYRALSTWTLERRAAREAKP